MKQPDQVTRIEDSTEAWESGTLGADPKFIRQASVERHAEVDGVLGMQSISIRLEKDLIEKFKMIAKINGLGYQPLMRDALRRFADSEIKIILAQLAEKKVRQKDAKSDCDCEPEVDRRKAA